MSACGDFSADPLDQAAQVSEAHNQACLQRVQQAAKPQQVRNPDGTWPVTECVDCDDEIPAERLDAMGCIRCVICQTKKERNGGLYAT